MKILRDGGGGGAVEGVEVVGRKRSSAGFVYGSVSAQVAVLAEFEPYERAG